MLPDERNDSRAFASYLSDRTQATAKQQVPMATPMAGARNPVEQGENQIDTPDHGQGWHNDADWESIESKPSPERQTCNQQHAKAVAEVKPDPSSPHVRAPTR